MQSQHFTTTLNKHEHTCEGDVRHWISLMTFVLPHPQAGFTLGNVVGMYLAQNYDVSFCLYS